MNGPADSTLKTILWEGYGLRPEAIREVPGGLLALAYEVIGEGKRYFLKVYPHSRCGVSRWIAAIPTMPPCSAQWQNIPR